MQLHSLSFLFWVSGGNIIMGILTDSILNLAAGALGLIAFVLLPERR